MSVFVQIPGPPDVFLEFQTLDAATVAEAIKNLRKSDNSVRIFTAGSQSLIVDFSALPSFLITADHADRGNVITAFPSQIGL